MLRNNQIGPKCLYNPTMNLINWNTAEIAATDSTQTAKVIYPVSYSATVQENHDHCRFDVVTAVAQIASTMKWACGVFLTADNEKGNLLFTAEGCINLLVPDDKLVIYPFFGRLVGSTVEYSKAAQVNQTTEYRPLPVRGVAGDGAAGVSLSFKEEIISLGESGGKPYVAGWIIENGDANADVWMSAYVSLQKFATSIPIFDPQR